MFRRDNTRQIHKGRNDQSFQEGEFRGRRVVVKRDDLLRTVGGLNGNKARKFAHLERQLFEGKRGDGLDRELVVVSHGGLQSNAMLALARLCASHRSIRAAKTRLLYFTRPAPPHLHVPHGNFKRALDMDMEWVPLDPCIYSRVARYIHQKKHAVSDTTEADAKRVVHDHVRRCVRGPEQEEQAGCQSAIVWAPQGGYDSTAGVGMDALARECYDWMARESESSAAVDGRAKGWAVVVESGMGHLRSFLHVRSIAL